MTGMHRRSRQTWERPAASGWKQGAAWVVFSCLGCVVVSCHWDEPATQEALPFFGPEDVEISLGVKGIYHGAPRSQLRLRFHNHGADFRGELLVRGLVTSSSLMPGATPPTGFGAAPGTELLFDPIAYHLDAELPSNTVREFVLPVCAEGWEEIQVDLRQGDYDTQFRSAPLQVIPTPLSMLVVGTSIPDLRHLETTVTDCFRQSQWNARPPARCSPTTVDPRELPPLACGYGGFHAVVLYGTGLAGEPPERIQALETWVRRGGSLLIFPGKEWDSGPAPELLELAGVRRSPESQPDALVERLPLSKSPPYVTALERRDGGSESAVPRDGGLYFERRLGCGVVTTSAVTPTAGIFPAEDGAPLLYGWLKRALLRGVSVQANPEPALTVWDDSALNLLQKRTGLRVPPATSLAIALLTYVLVGIALPAVYCKRRGRPEWTFVWIVVVAGLTSFGIYRYGLLAFGEEAKLQELSLARLHADGSGAEVSSFVGLTSPSQDHLSPQSGRAETAVGPLVDGFAQTMRTMRWLGLSNPELLRGREIAVDAAGRALYRPVVLRPNSLESFRVEYSLPAQEIVSVKTDESDGTVHVRNRSSEPLLALASSGGRLRLRETLEPGEELAVSQVTLKNYLEIRPGKRWRHSEFRDVEDLAGALVSWNRKEYYLPSVSPDHHDELPGALLLVTKETLFPLRIEGYKHRGESLLLLELPPTR
jgi:hypothetical protein